MNTLTITLTNTRHIDGFIIAANGAGMTPEALLAEFVANQGARYADNFKVGIITGSAFVARFTPQEYSDILTYAADIQPVPDPVYQVPTAEEQQMYDDAVAAYELLEEPTEEDTAMYQSMVDTYNNIINTVTNQAEIDAITAANEPHEQVAELLNMLFATSDVHLDDPRLQPGLDLLVSLSLLDAARPAEILVYDRPTPEVN